MCNMTTTGSIRVEDITFKGARKQSEIDKEIVKGDSADIEVKVPVSLTPEQVVVFYKSLIVSTRGTPEKLVYAQTIKWIEELQKLKAEVRQMKLREERDNVNSDKPTDLEL